MPFSSHELVVYFKQFYTISFKFTRKMMRFMQSMRSYPA